MVLVSGRVVQPLQGSSHGRLGSDAAEVCGAGKSAPNSPPPLGNGRIRNYDGEARDNSSVTCVSAECGWRSLVVDRVARAEAVLLARFLES